MFKGTFDECRAKVVGAMDYEYAMRNVTTDPKSPTVGLIRVDGSLTKLLKNGDERYALQLRPSDLDDDWFVLSVNDMDDTYGG